MEGQASMLSKGGDECLDLPPGFRFHPTDEEIITHYLSHKVLNRKFRAVAIGETDFNKYEPWDLPLKAKMGEKEWYFFFQRDRKYPTGLRTNRATEAGYWKATGKDKEIYKGKSCLVGMKKTLVFYRGRAPKGEKTNWVMHEFRLEGKFSYHNIPRTAKDEWVVCRVFHKSSSIKKSPISGMLRMNSFVDGLIDSPTLPSLMDSQYLNRPGPSFFADQEEEIFKGIASTTSLLKASDGLVQMPYFSMEDHQHDQKTYLPNNLQRNPYDHHPLQNSFMYSQKNPSLGSSVNLGYLHQARNELEFGELRKLCKMEQFSNQSMISQDTGLSTDRTTEISSMVSKQEMGSFNQSYEDLEDPSSGAALDSLESLWSY